MPRLLETDPAVWRTIAPSGQDLACEKLPDYGMKQQRSREALEGAAAASALPPSPSEVPHEYSKD
jgi:hypothetical protein